MGPVGLRERVLGGEEALGGRAVALALGVLLEGVGHGDRPVTQVLAVHGLNGGVRGVKAGEIDEGVALGVPCIRVPHDLRRLQDDAEGTERVIEELLVDLRVQVADEDVGAHVQVLVVRRGLVDPDGLAVELDHVHDLYGVVGVFLAEELHKAVAFERGGRGFRLRFDIYTFFLYTFLFLPTLMLSRDSVFWHVCVDHRSGLQEELP